jgi:hypothetical protein
MSTSSTPLFSSSEPVLICSGIVEVLSTAFPSLRHSSASPFLRLHGGSSSRKRVIARYYIKGYRSVTLIVYILKNYGIPETTAQTLMKLTICGNNSFKDKFT